jgi:hypothetical protein
MMNRHFLRYLEGKRVVFVGASPILQGRNLGAYIDDFDVVVRTNGSIDLIRDPLFQRDYGSKCHVLYTNNQFYREMRPFPDQEWRSRGVEWLCMKRCNTRDYVRFSSHLRARLIAETINQIKGDLPSAAMGVILAYDILLRRPKVFEMTGIDFFASRKKVFEHDNYREYVPGYLPDKIRIQGNKINRGKTEDGHDFLGNARYFDRLRKKYSQLTFPPFVAEILDGILRGGICQK